MLKEINHRYSFYLTMVIVVVLLLLIYLEVKTLRQDVTPTAIADNSYSSTEYLSENYDNNLQAEFVDLEAVAF